MTDIERLIDRSSRTSMWNEGPVEATVRAYTPTWANTMAGLRRKVFKTPTQWTTQDVERYIAFLTIPRENPRAARHEDWPASMPFHRFALNEHAVSNDVAGTRSRLPKARRRCLTCSPWTRWLVCWTRSPVRRIGLN